MTLLQLFNCGWGRQHMSWVSLRSFFWLLVLIVVISEAGCEELPRPAAPNLPVPSDTETTDTIPTNTVTTNTVTTDGGRGNYNWKLVGGSFPVVRHFDFPLLENVDRSKFTANWTRGKQSKVEPPERSPLVDEELYQRLLNLHAPQPSAAPLMALSPSEEIGTHQFALSFNGQLLVTVGSKVILWDVAKSSRVREWDAPCENALFVTLDREAQSVVMCDESGVYRLSRDSDGSESWKMPAGKIKHFVAARDARQYGILTDTGALVHLNESLTASSTRPRHPLDQTRIAIHPNGSRIIAGNKKQLMQWQPADGQPPAVVAFNAYVDDTASPVVPLIGAEYDRLVFMDEVFEHRALAATNSTVSRASEPPYFCQRNIRDAFVATDDRVQDWLVIGFQQATPAGGSEYVLCDTLLSEGLCSLPFSLGTKRPLAIHVNSNASVVAVENADGLLSVVKRQPWLDPSGEKLALDIAQTAADGRFEEAEWCADWLRCMAAAPGYPSGEELFLQIAERVGEIEHLASERVNDPNSQAIVTRLKAWYGGGTRLAQLSQVCSTLPFDSTGARRTAWFPLPGGASDPKLMQSQAMLADLLSEDGCPVAALDLMVNVSYLLGSDPPALERTLISFMESHPRELAPYAGFCRLLAPNWTGEKGQVGAYLDRVSKLWPEDERDVFYARCVARVWEDLPPGMVSAGPESLGLDIDRLWRGTEKMMTNETASAQDLSLLLELTLRHGDPKLTEKLSAYYQRHYPLLDKSAYRRSIVGQQVALLKTRTAKQRSAERP